MVMRLHACQRNGRETTGENVQNTGTTQVRRAFSEAPNPSGSKYHQDPDTRKVMSPVQIQNSGTHTSNLTKKNIVVPLVHPLDSNLSMSSTGNH
ncbi:hypothetical protein I7I48_04066 [Histoplasma ohiense]|nr:hypothetical protein I7I48_04066 [Histoplasma ohiense (nom. inval.)]